MATLYVVHMRRERGSIDWTRLGAWTGILAYVAGFWYGAYWLFKVVRMVWA